MSQTYTNTSNGQNWNQNSGKDGRGQGGPNGGGRGNCCNGSGNTTIAKYAFEGNMKDGPISKLLITKTGHRPTQFKKISNTPPVLCADKNLQGLDEVFWTGTYLDEGNFMPPYLDTNQWSTTHCVQPQY